MPGWHTGPHLAEAFIEVLDHVNIVSKVCIRLIITNHLTADIGYFCRSVGSLLITLLIMIALLSTLNGSFDVEVLNSYTRKTISGIDYHLASPHSSLRSWHLDAFLIL